LEIDVKRSKVRIEDLKRELKAMDEME